MPFAPEQRRPGVPSWRERITGRWALSWQTYTLGVVINLPLLVLTGGRIGTRIVPLADMGVLLLYGVAASAIVGAWALIMNATVFRARRVRPVTLWQFGMLHLVSGAVFGAAVILADRQLGIEVGVPPLLTLLATMGIALWWGTTTALLLEAHQRFVSERARLLDEAVRGQLALMSESRADLVMYDEATARNVSATLSQARSRLELRLTEGASLATWLEAAQDLRAAADETVRPLSHALWREASARFPEPRVSGVVSLLLREPVFLPLPAASVIVIGYLGATTQAYGTVVGPILALTLGVVTVALLTAGNAAMRRLPRLRQLVYVATIVILQGVALLLAYGPARAAGEVLPPSLIAGSIIGTLISVLLTSSVASLDASRTYVIQQLQTTVNQERIAQVARTRARAVALREIAQDLHGSVQTRLIACASAIERAAASGDAEAYDLALREGLSILEGERASDRGTVGAQLAVLAESWGALCDVTLHVEPSVSGSTHADIARVVEEAMGNAYRHGEATHIDVDVRSREGEVYVEVRDNGHGPAGGGPGLGSDLLAQATRGRHRLTAGSHGGAVLTAVLPSEG